MITIIEKKEIIETLGGRSHYSKKIIPYLEKLGIKPERAEVFTTKILQQIMNGYTENETVERAIFTMVKNRKKQLQKSRL